MQRDRYELINRMIDRAYSSEPAMEDTAVLRDALRQMKEDVRRIEVLERNLAHFADILAASAERALDRRTTSKTERERQLAIIQMVLMGLRNAPLNIISRPIPVVINRVKRVLERYEELAPPKK